MSLHEDLLNQLKSIANVSLVASLRDERLNVPDADVLHIFLPDIHLITAARLAEGKFAYGTNHLSLLQPLVESLTRFKNDAGGTVTVYQIGDLIDLWRQTDGLEQDLDVASAIQNDHEDLFVALLDPSLNTQFLLGNHDYDLCRFPNFDAWQRCLFLSRTAMVVHGDVFDWVEKLPDAVQNYFVFLFSPFAQPGKADLEHMRSLNQQMRKAKSFAAFIQDQSPAPLGMLRHTEDIPDRWNVQAEGTAPDGMLTFLDEARQKCAEANQRFGMALRVAVIGHTHHARIAVRDSGGDLFTLIDCGAWIEDCVTEGDSSPQKNAQIAALGANEARIYQLAPKA